MIKICFLTSNQLIHFSRFFTFFCNQSASAICHYAHLASAADFPFVPCLSAFYPILSHISSWNYLFSLPPWFLSDAISRASVCHGTKVHMITGQKITLVSVVVLRSTEKTYNWWTVRKKKKTCDELHPNRELRYERWPFIIRWQL